jgi:penicillin-binding protein 1C
MQMKNRLAVWIMGIMIAILAFALIDLQFPFQPLPKWSVMVNDRNGRLLNAYLSQDEKWRFPCRPEETDSLLIATILKKEDRWFYYHPGINPFAFARAAWSNISSGKRVSGASTITMQVVRLLEPRKRTLASKLTECFRALQLEAHYSKEEILGLYLSLVPYGGNVEGVKTASWLYFGKPPALLSPAEAITLAIIPNRPSSMRPGKARQVLVLYRNRWLNTMREEGIISDEQLSDALAEPLVMERKASPSLAPHLSRRLKTGNGKTTLHTTIEAGIQEKVVQLCYNHMQRLKNTGIHNACALVIDNRNGEVLAYAGSADFSDRQHYGEVDGIRAVRSPGSTLKPFVYGMAMDEGLITPKTILEDVPVNYAGYSPENFDRQFHGAVSAEDALSASLNIPAVSLVERIGPALFRERLIEAGCTNLKKQKEIGLSAILGGCGVSLEELCTLYSALANEGKAKKLRYSKGKADSTGFALLSSSASFLLSAMLSKASRHDLPALFENNLHIPKIAWKTGTSYGRRDAWSIGYNRRYTIGVWVGNFDGTGTPELTGADCATPLLFALFNSIDFNSQAKWFRPDSVLDLRYVCPKTGLSPGLLCTERVIDYYLPGTSSMEVCDHLKEFKTDAAQKISYCTACEPEKGYRTGIYENPSPALLRFYRENRIPIQLPPAHNPECKRLFEGRAPQIQSLSHGEEYLIEKDEAQSLELSCALAADATSASWTVNNRFFKTAAAGEKLFFHPKPGINEIRCEDDKGRTSEISVRVVFY